LQVGFPKQNDAFTEKEKKDIARDLQSVIDTNRDIIKQYFDGEIDIHELRVRFQKLT